MAFLVAARAGGSLQRTATARHSILPRGAGGSKRRQCRCGNVPLGRRCRISQYFAETCFLRGVPRLIFSGQNGERLPTAICPNCDDYLFPARPVTTVVLKSGELAHVLSRVYHRLRFQALRPRERNSDFLTRELHRSLCERARVVLLREDRRLCFSSLARPGTTRAGTAPKTPAAAGCGDSSSQGVQLSLTPFTHWQRVGILGFHLALSGFLAPPSTRDNVNRPRSACGNPEKLSSPLTSSRPLGVRRTARLAKPLPSRRAADRT